MNSEVSFQFFFSGFEKYQARHFEISSGHRYTYILLLIFFFPIAHESQSTHK